MRRMVVGVATMAVLGAAGYFAIRPSVGIRRNARAESKPPVLTPATSKAEPTPAEIFASQGREGLTAAVENYKGIIAKSPDNVAAYSALGSAYMLLGKVDEAENTLKEGIARCPSPKPGTKVELLKDAVHLRTNLANLCMAKGDFPRAQALLEEVVAISPADAAAHNNLANAFVLQGKFDLAGPQYDLATALQADNPETWCNWGTMLYHANRMSEAEAKFRKAIALNKDGAKYYYWLGRVLRKQGRIGAAIKAEETARVTDTKMVEPWLELGAIYVQINELKEAESYLRGALTLDKENLEGTVNLARVLLLTKDKSNVLEAALLFRKAVELTGEKDVNLLTQMADTYALGEFYEQAEEALQKALVVAREQKLSALDREVLLQHLQEYKLLQQKPEAAAKGVPTPVTAEGAEGLLPSEESSNPYDVPENARRDLPAAKALPPGAIGAGDRR